MLQLLEEHRDVRHFQLVGKGGSSCGGAGKTSTLLNLAFSLTSSSNAPDIAPLYIQLRRIYGINSKSKNNENRILHYMREEYSSQRLIATLPLYSCWMVSMRSRLQRCKSDALGISLTFQTRNTRRQPLYSAIVIRWIPTWICWNMKTVLTLTRLIRLSSISTTATSRNCRRSRLMTILSQISAVCSCCS